MLAQTSVLRRALLLVAGRNLSRLSSSDAAVSAPFEGIEEEEEEPEEYMRTEKKLTVCESWVHSLESGNKEGIVELDREIFGLPPRADLLAPIVLRQLRHQIQHEPYGREENNFINFDRLSDAKYSNRGDIKPRVQQGLAWNHKPYVPNLRKPLEEIPEYHGSVPRRLREMGIRILLSMKYRYKKLHLVEELGTSTYLQPGQLAELLEQQGFSSVLMITGNTIHREKKKPVDEYQGKVIIRRKTVIPNPDKLHTSQLYPGTQRLFKTVSETPQCEMREIFDLDVYTGLLYDSLIIDLPALQKLNISYDKFETGNMSLISAMDGLECTVEQGPRQKIVRIVNLDNL